ncbi:MAG: hypothetical protein WC714_28950 [Candidatus Obscuribacterales bacterium]|jgi:hypothetical protein
MAAGGKWYYCDPTFGTTGGDGLSAESACSNLATVYDLCRDGYNDGVIFIGGATAYNPAAAFTWSKSYCHLVGISADLPGLGQRCRFVMLAATALTPAITFSGSGNVIANMQFYNEKAAGSAAGCVVVTGSRNLFQNVFFMSPVATDAASYSLKVNGSENVFSGCTIGQFTNPRTAASYGLWLYGTTTCLRNKFIGCEFLSWGYNADHVHVFVDSSITVVPWTIWFENCLFQHNATALTQAVDDNCTAAGHQIVFRGRDTLMVNSGVVGDVLTYMFCPDLYHATASGLLAVTVAES